MLNCSTCQSRWLIWFVMQTKLIRNWRLSASPRRTTPLAATERCVTVLAMNQPNRTPSRYLFCWLCCSGRTSGLEFYYEYYVYKMRDKGSAAVFAARPEVSGVRNAKQMGQSVSTHACILMQGEFSVYSMCSALSVGFVRVRHHRPTPAHHRKWWERVWRNWPKLKSFHL